MRRTGSARAGGLPLRLPLFLPDGTMGVVRNLDSADLRTVGTEAVVVNTYHLLSTPGSEVLKSAGGLKKLMGFEGLMVSDSGGWQCFSLIHRAGSRGRITDAGVVFALGGGKNRLFTPEISIRAQFDIGSDVFVCLDDFTDPAAGERRLRESVDRTTLWARKSREAYDRALEERAGSAGPKPLLLAVIQGGFDREARTRSAGELVELGFDGYGFGGYVVENGRINLDLSAYVAELIPRDKIGFALGFGRPWDIAALWEMGWEMFDCTLPTRDARHKRLYAFRENPRGLSLEALKKPESYEYLYLRRDKHARDFDPVSRYCDCPACARYSRGYLFHLFDIGDGLALRLATLHNLRTYQLLIERLRLLGKPA
jgi:queuine tRNA-ribosyltransferase